MKGTIKKTKNAFLLDYNEEDKIITEMHCLDNIHDQVTFLQDYYGVNLGIPVSSQYCIRYHKKAKGIIHIGNKDHKIDENTSIILNPEQKHNLFLEIPENTLSSTFCLGADGIKNFVTALTAKDDCLLEDPQYQTKDLHNFEISVINNNFDINNLIYKICEKNKYIPNIVSFELLQEACIQELLINLFNNEYIQYRNRLSNEKSSYIVNQEISRRLSKVIDYINSNYMEKITTSILSEICGLSKSYFILQFKNMTGLSPHKYIINIRLEKAKQMLKDTSNSISEISFDLGFYDIHSFSKSFKSKYGFTPSEYRKIM